MTKQNKILKRVGEFSVISIYYDRQKRLKKLVEQHGFENVALAGGWSIGTVEQYCRVSNPQSISDVKLVQAETVLEGL